MNAETDEQTATRIGVSLEDYHRIIAWQTSEVKRLGLVPEEEREFYGHTSGPWEYANTNQYTPEQFDIFESRNARTIARTINGPKELSEANAKLICAAPALLRERDDLRAKVRTLTLALHRWHDNKFVTGTLLQAEIESAIEYLK